MTSANFNPDAQRRRLAALLLSAVAAATTFLVAPLACQAQGDTRAPAAVNANARPTWDELTPVQQRILAPLSGEWNNFPELNRRKWLQIAERYPKFSPADQARLQTRMSEWVKLTPQQRRVARENYQITRSLPAKKKAEAWDEYQQLPEEQKKNLAAAEKVPRRPGAVSALPSGKRLPAETTRQLHPEKKAPATGAAAAKRTPAPASAPAPEPQAAPATAPAALPAPREAATEATASSPANPDDAVRR